MQMQRNRRLSARQQPFGARMRVLQKAISDSPLTGVSTVSGTHGGKARAGVVAGDGTGGGPGADHRSSNEDLCFECGGAIDAGDSAGALRFRLRAVKATPGLTGGRSQEASVARRKARQPGKCLTVRPNSEAKQAQVAVAMELLPAGGPFQPLFCTRSTHPSPSV